MEAESDQKPSSGERLAEALVRGRTILLQLLDDVGGLWTAAQAAEHLSILPSELQAWMENGQVLALQRGDGSYAYPVAQFAQSVTRGRPYPGIAEVISVVGDYMTSEELAGFLASPRRALALPSHVADTSARARTGFDAIAAGDADLIVNIVRRFVTPPDSGAHQQGESYPQSATHYLGDK